MGNSVILTKNHPSELGTIAQAEAFQITLLGGPTGEQQVLEQHGWWDEQNQKAEWLATTLKTETAVPFDVARNAYNHQIVMRVAEGFVHSRSYSFNEGKFVYRDLRQTEGFEQLVRDYNSDPALFRAVASRQAPKLST
jgi:hypothetical protein